MQTLYETIELNRDSNHGPVTVRKGYFQLEMIKKGVKSAEKELGRHAVLECQKQKQSVTGTTKYKIQLPASLRLLGEESVTCASNALGPRLIPPKNRQGLPSHGWAGLKRQAQRVRVAPLNVGSITGKGRELVDLMERRKIGELCMQETRWKENKARELDEGCKFYYNGVNMEGRIGVGIIFPEDLKESLIGENRKNDRIMSLKLGLGVTIANVVCSSATQTGYTEEEKDTFLEEMDQELGKIPARERVIIGDLNGHL
ncbi:uncharacterized protein [Palaemon carinicauda]|uniref:uncharacterized protein n=1 Tax=Palaemon carinicauda TaxID=392227 RepID=UPI0035B5E665